MQKLTRTLVGAAGFLALLMAVGFWIRPVAIAGKLGLQPLGDLGLASLRADLGGFFGAAGALALLAALRNRRELLTAPLMLIGVALTGRVVSLAITGPSPALIQPMVVEAVLLAIMGLGYRTLSRAQS